MPFCQWISTPFNSDTARLECVVCGTVRFHADANYFRECRAESKRGPGDYLHSAIIRWVGEEPTRECSCADRIIQMNLWGPAGCREHLAEIVEWLREEAVRRGWWQAKLPGAGLLIRAMVVSAIHQSEQEK